MFNNASKLILVSIVINFLISNLLYCQGLKYFGQEPPGMTPVRFPPASLLANDDWFWHGSPNFSPDFKEVYWGKYSKNPQPDRIELAFVEIVDSQWTQMQTPTFASINYEENNPVFSSGGDTIFYLSKQPMGYIFYVSRTSTGWSQPVQLDIPLPANKKLGWDFSVTKDNSIYMPLFDVNGSSPPDIYKTSYSNGQYTMPESLGTPVNSDYNEFWLYIDPDERFLIFISNRPGGSGMHDLYISSRNQNGTWSDPVNLGPEINSNQEDGAPYISPDGLYFFFTNWRVEDLGYNPYWVDAQVVYDLITDVEDAKNSANFVTFQLYQNYPNPFNPTTLIRYEIPDQSFVTIKVYDVLGNEITTLVDEEKPKGLYKIEFDGVSLASGIYFYELRTNDFIQTKKMILLR